MCFAPFTREGCGHQGINLAHGLEAKLNNFSVDPVEVIGPFDARSWRGFLHDPGLELLPSQTTHQRTLSSSW